MCAHLAWIWRQLTPPLPQSTLRVQRMACQDTFYVLGNERLPLRAALLADGGGVPPFPWAGSFSGAERVVEVKLAEGPGESPLEGLPEMLGLPLPLPLHVSGQSSRDPRACSTAPGTPCRMLLPHARQKGPACLREEGCGGAQASPPPRTRSALDPSVKQCPEAPSGIPPHQEEQSSSPLK